MPEVAVVGGTNILNQKVLDYEKTVEVDTPYGRAEVEVGNLNGIEIALLRRHGRKSNVPPHKINHAANFYALKKLGVKDVIGMGSVGCLRADVRLPALAVPHDYIDFFSFATTVEDKLVHVTPGFDERLREMLIDEAKKVCPEKGYNLLDKAVYFQSRGPRLETKAEIRVISQWADCVGMTAGSEATVAKELNLNYATICTVDNYANGIKDEDVDYREIVKRAKVSASVCLKVVFKVVERILSELWGCKS